MTKTQTETEILISLQPAPGLVHTIFNKQKMGPVNLSKVLHRSGFWGYGFKATVFGLLATSKTAPLKPHPKNRTPKKLCP